MKTYRTILGVHFKTFWGALFVGDMYFFVRDISQGHYFEGLVMLALAGVAVLGFTDRL